MAEGRGASGPAPDTAWTSGRQCACPQVRLATVNDDQLLKRALESSLCKRRRAVIGANQAAIVYEIGVIDGVAAPVVVHAMKARNRFLR